VASAAELRLVAEVIVDHVPEDADISGIAVAEGRRRIVTIRTATVGRVIGRGGASVQAIRDALAQRLDDPELQVNVLEDRGPAGD
jgi:ribosomal protein S3